jgi:hypothetical protein
MNNKKEKVVIPFVHGRGKTGVAKNGEERVLIKETYSYPQSFAHFKRICNEMQALWDKEYGSIETDKVDIRKQMLDYINSLKGHINDTQLPTGEEVIFLNLDMFKSKDYNYLRSVAADGQKIYLT